MNFYVYINVLHKIHNDLNFNHACTHDKIMQPARPAVRRKPANIQISKLLPA